MPRDDWAKARNRDLRAKAERKAAGKLLHTPRRRKDGSPLKSWKQAIYQAKSHADLSAVGRSLKVLHDAGKISGEEFAEFIEAGKRRRAQLARHTAN